MSIARPESKVAALFPGQGSQQEGMEQEIERFCPELLQIAVREVGEDLFERIDTETEALQPVMYCAVLARWRALGEPDVEACAGHSLGEYGALVAAGALDPEDGLEVVLARARAMQRVAGGMDGGMLAVLGGDSDLAESLAREHGLVVACDNAPGQVVLSGDRGSFPEARAAAKEAGVRAVPVPVSAAMHSPAMEAAQEEFRPVVSRLRFEEPRFPVISNVTAQPFDGQPADLLVAALAAPVRWRESLQTLRGLGAEVFMETGPGSVLSRFVRRTLPDAEIVSPTADLAVG